MKKSELRKQIENGEILGSLFQFVPGQECEIYKAEKFFPGDKIIYIPDTTLNRICVDCVVTDREEIDDLIQSCYTGNDFLDLVGGDMMKAKELFAYVDWQHPSSALPELEMCWNDEEFCEEPSYQAYIASRRYSTEYDPIVVLALEENDAMDRAKRHFGINTEIFIGIAKLIPTEADSHVFIAE